MADEYAPQDLPPRSQITCIRWSCVCAPACAVRVLNSLIPMGADYWCLFYRLRGLPEDVKRKALDEYHEKWRDEPLRVCLDLRGFYVKVGQLCAGFPGDGLPAPYKQSLKCLQENVPPQPYARIKQIAEAELGCPLEEVFAEFEASPIGAASIGQVHRARLHDGTDVVVKVQYPECERNFRLDFATIMSIFKLGAQLVLRTTCVVGREHLESD